MPKGPVGWRFFIASGIFARGGTPHMDADIRCHSEAIEIVEVATVIEDPENLRLHPDRNLVAIVESLKRFGQQKPIVVDSANICRAGNGTLAAAKYLEWESIAIVRSDLPAPEAKAYAVADNRTTDLSHFDREELAKSLAKLEAEPDLLAATGFADNDLTELLELADKITSGEDDLDQEQPPQTLLVHAVSQQDKDDVVGRINEALLGTGLRAIAY